MPRNARSMLSSCEILLILIMLLTFNDPNLLIHNRRFCKDERNRVKEANKDFKASEVTKELGKLWGEVDAATKTKYEKMVEKDKARYEKVTQKLLPCITSADFLVYRK